MMTDIEDRHLLPVLLVCVLVGLFLRIETATTWPLQNDEAVHLYRSWVLATDGHYQYTPWTHGPFLYYVSALILPFSGWDLVVARAITSFLWLLSILGLWWLRDRLGRLTVLVAAIMLSIHHYPVWMSAYFRNDIILISITLLWLGLAQLYVDQPTWGRGLGLGAVGGLSIAVKETAFLIAFVLLATAVLWVSLRVALRPGFDREWWRTYGRPAIWSIPAGGMIVLVILFTGSPVTLSGVITAPVDALTGPLFWLQPDQIIRARNGPWYYAQLLARSPLILVTGLTGAGLALKSRQLIPVAIMSLFSFFFVLHSFVTKQPPRFVLYMIVPLIVLSGYAIQRGFATRQLPRQWVLPIVIVFALVASAGVSGAVGPGGSPNSLYPTWGLDEHQKETLQTAELFAEETNCPVHVTEDSVNHQVSRWYLRQTPVTHGRWNTSVSISAEKHVTVSSSPINTSYPIQSVHIGEFVVTSPVNRCSNQPPTNMNSNEMLVNTLSFDRWT